MSTPPFLKESAYKNRCWQSIRERLSSHSEENRGCGALILALSPLGAGLLSRHEVSYL